MPNSTQSAALRYGGAITAVTIATIIRLLLDPVLGERQPFTIYIIAVVFAAWSSRLLPALMATALGAMAASFFFVPPRDSLSITGTEGFIELSIYLFAGVTIAALGEAMSRSASRDREASQTDTSTLRATWESGRRSRQNESYKRYRALYEDNPAMYFMVDAEGKILSVNRFGAEQLGYEVEELVDSPVLDVFHEEDREAVVKQMSECMQNPKQVATWEFRKVRKDGSMLWVKEFVRAVRDSDGKMVALIVCEDITERKRAEERFSKAFYASPHSMSLISLKDRRFIDTNDSALRLIGYDREEVIGRTPVELNLWADPEDRNKALNRIKEIGKVRNLDIRFRTKSGQIRDGLFSAEIIEIAGEACILSTTTDVTERKRTEAALVESQKTYETLVNSINGIVWEGDPQTFGFSFVSKQAEKLLGYPLERWLKEQDFWKNHIHPDDQEWAVNFCIETSAENSSHQFEYRMVAADGRIVWLRDMVTVVVESDGSKKARGVMIDITESKRAEEAIGASEKLFSKAFHSSPIEMSIIRLKDGCYVDMNDSALSRTGYAREEVVGRPASELYLLIDPDDPDKKRRLIEDRRTFRNLEVKSRRKSGEVRVNLMSAEIIELEGEQCLLLVANDITERKRAEEEKTRLMVEIESHRQRMNSIFATVPGVVWEAWGEPDEANQRIDFVSNYVETMTGYIVQEWLSNPNFWLTIVHPDDKERAAREAASFFTSGKGGVSQFRWVAKDGSVLWVEAQSVVVFDSENRPIGMRGVTMDITERKRAEERQRFLAEASNVLASSLDFEVTLQNLARLATPTLADWCAVYMLEDNGQIRQLAVSHTDPAKSEWTEECELRYLLDTNALVSATNVMRTGAPVFYPEIPDHWFRDLPGKGQTSKTPNELGMKSAMIVPLLARGRSLGAITFISAETRYAPADLALAEDLAHRATLAVDNAQLYREAQEAIAAREEALRLHDELLVREKIARTEAEAANRAKDEFLATVSHELRTPLNAILGWAHMLRGGNVDRATSARALETIERNAKSQAQIIEDILDVSRIITGKLRLEVSPVDLTSIIEAAIESGRLATEAKEIELQSTLEPAAGLVSGDLDRLQQIVWNLLSNAVKFTPRGGRVQVQLKRLDSQAHLIVSDTGQGIAPELLPYVFDRFRQADSTTRRKHGGIGLGLAIVRHLVEMHGGTAHAESPGKDKGATFTVKLPLMDGTREGRVSELTVASAAEGGMFEMYPLLEGLRVLVVDDDGDTRHMLALTLSQRRADVRTCSSTVEALAMLEEWKPDVLVSDIQMPDEDGYDLIRKVRQSGSERCRGIPAVALTAYARVEDRMRALSAGYNIHLPKPVEPVELATVIASLSGKDNRTIF